MEVDRDYYLDWMTFRPVKRPMFSELFGPLVGLEAEWRAQGASQEEIDMVAWDWDYVRRVDCGANTGPCGAPEEMVIEETSEYILTRDGLGRICKLCKGVATCSLPLDFPVKRMEDWLRLKPLFIFKEERIDWGLVEQARRARADGALVVGNIQGGFDTARALMGEEIACTAYYEQPEMMKDVLDTLRDTALKVYERVTEKVIVDVLSIHEDLAGKSGPLVGPRQVREFIGPYYRAVWDLVSSRGTRLFHQDSDGNIGAVLELFAEAGVNVFLPMEPAAGMDVVATRQKFGQRIAFLGGIDKHVLRQDRAAIRRELEYKMQPLMRQGGIVFGLDHRITNGTPLANYRYYAETGRAILGLPPLNPGHKGWGRMAF